MSFNNEGPYQAIYTVLIELIRTESISIESDKQMAGMLFQHWEMKQSSVPTSIALSGSKINDRFCGFKGIVNQALQIIGRFAFQSHTSNTGFRGEVDFIKIYSHERWAE